ncbi:hypothetical protein HETIRDRAFT_152123 [Heterobasidion irregulare TC 32-1]|uniref:Cytochrome P450 n=1 Tax=Heterobasidion irregulare (strain TC 32-1) TaxID=747525 RepID=W4JUB8_HETIT|nr:uncharacterized protein HETIRDRAFT_152123 [Heterobasidion irregulare TC 32-1]ETW77148.1 hypothetical protein HETIRDRAFT_152123 [Heterobasidion irregulare TC 32-1]
MSDTSTLSSTLVAALSVVSVVYASYKIFGWILYPLLFSLRDVRGPKAPSWFYGHIRTISYEGERNMLGDFGNTYGRIFKIRGFFNRPRLVALDTRALSHILSHHDDFVKPERVRYTLGQVVGQGLLVVQGEQHKQQRRIMNPAFGPAQIRELTAIFVDKSIELRNLWMSELTSNGQNAIDVMAWLNKMTLDVIGLAGFNYPFNALSPDGKSNEMNAAVRTMFAEPDGGRTRLTILQTVLPLLRLIPSESQARYRAAQNTMMRVGQELLAEKKNAILAGNAGHEHKMGRGAQEFQGRDLLSLLIKANMATDLPEGSRMVDHDVLAQIATFIVAGHETTSTAVTWALFALSNNLDTQTKLRKELASLPTETPNMDELENLPYLDAVVRETLRLYSPVANTVRVAMKDDVIPTDEEWVDAKGVRRQGIRIKAGDEILIPIAAVNRLKALWGEDAGKFKPERWEHTPNAVHSIPGIWGNSLAFLGGPRACIGYRFSVVEMKSLLFVLVRAFQFQATAAPEDFKIMSTIVQRPVLKSRVEQGPQMPLLVSTISAE